MRNNFLKKEVYVCKNFFEQKMHNLSFEIIKLIQKFLT